MPGLDWSSAATATTQRGVHIVAVGVHELDDAGAGVVHAPLTSLAFGTGDRRDAIDNADDGARHIGRERSAARPRKRIVCECQNCSRGGSSDREAYAFLHG